MCELTTEWLSGFSTLAARSFSKKRIPTLSSSDRAGLCLWQRIFDVRSFVGKVITSLSSQGKPLIVMGSPINFNTPSVI